MAALATLLLLPFAMAQPQATPPPTTERQTELLSKMTDYSETYLQNLPSFLCTQVTVHYSSGLKHVKWSKGDTVVAQLSYNNGEEHQKIETINDKVPKTPPRSWRWKLTSAGEFGNQLYNVFAESSKTGFGWSRWDTLRGHNVAVFDYTIQKENSTMTLSMMGVKAVVGYKGSVWADATSGQVWRIDNHALDIPAELEMEEIGTTTDYEPVTIAGRTYVLPIHSEVVEKDPKEYKKNVVDFQEYRQFRADSVLRFDGPADDAPAQQTAPPPPPH